MTYVRNMATTVETVEYFYEGKGSILVRQADNVLWLGNLTIHEFLALEAEPDKMIELHTPFTHSIVIAREITRCRCVPLPERVTVWRNYFGLSQAPCADAQGRHTSLTHCLLAQILYICSSLWTFTMETVQAVFEREIPVIRELGFHIESKLITPEVFELGLMTKKLDEVNLTRAEAIRTLVDYSNAKAAFANENIHTMARFEETRFNAKNARAFAAQAMVDAATYANFQIIDIGIPNSEIEEDSQYPYLKEEYIDNIRRMIDQAKAIRAGAAK